MTQRGRRGRRQRADRPPRYRRVIADYRDRLAISAEAEIRAARALM